MKKSTWQRNSDDVCETMVYFVDNHLKNVSENAVRVYLCVLRWADKDVTEIAKLAMAALDMPDYSVKYALIELRGCGALAFSESIEDNINGLPPADIELSELIGHIRSIAGRNLTERETQTYKELHTKLGLSCDVIECLAEYCFSNGRHTAPYIRMMGSHLAEKRVSNPEAARRILLR